VRLDGFGGPPGSRKKRSLWEEAPPKHRFLLKKSLAPAESLPTRGETVAGKGTGPAWRRPRLGAESERAVQDEQNDFQPNRVREIRENRLMTQAQLARKAKVALRTIHSVEKGMNCRMDTKRKILLALGMRFEDKEFVFPSLHRHGLPDLPPMPSDNGSGFAH
jgi:DNA-binding XRE family transcriptional regulator